MKFFRSVRSRIILISTFLLVSFLVLYTVTIWAIAGSYAAIDSARNKSFAFNVVSSNIANTLSNIDTLVRRVSIDVELKNILLTGDDRNWRDYFNRFESMVQSNPAYEAIDRFIITDSTCSTFLQVGGISTSQGRPLREDYFLEDISHVEAEAGFSVPFLSSLNFSETPVIGNLKAIIDYSTGRTLGYVYATVNLDNLLSNLYAYERLNGNDLVIEFAGISYKVKDSSLEEIVWPEPERKREIYSSNRSQVFSLKSGDLLLIHTSYPYFTSYEIFERPTLTGTSPGMPFIMLAIAVGFVIIVITITLSLYLNRVIYRPVKKLSSRIEKIQQSDFSQDEEIDTEDEFGLIGRGINKLSSEVTDLMDKRVEDERKKLELEYKMLQNQINPHFLYNTFNTIKWMATMQGADGIGEMITALARLMKNISKREESLVPLSEELSFIEDYLVIMKYRYGNTISYYKHIHEECIGLLIPRFTLQPLVENAIFHGIEPRGTGALSIVAQAFKDHYSIMVADNGVGFDSNEEKKGSDGVFKNIGLDNIRQRLAITYKGMASITINSSPGLGTECLIRIEKQKEENNEL